MANMHTTLKNLTMAKDLLENATQEFEALIEKVNIDDSNEDGSNVKRGELEDACRLYYHIRKEYDLVNDARKKIGGQLEHMSYNVIPNLMEVREVRNITLDDVSTRFALSHRTSATMLNKQEVMDWLRGIGAGDMITETVNASSLGSFVDEYVTEKQIDPPDCIQVKRHSLTSMTKVKSKEK